MSFILSYKFSMVCFTYEILAINCLFDTEDMVKYKPEQTWLYRAKKIIKIEKYFSIFLQQEF